MKHSEGKNTVTQQLPHSADLTGKTVPKKVLIAPWGQVDTSNGMFVVDDESAALVIEAFQQHGTDLPIDYEHQTLGGTFASPSGKAPAAGWIKTLTAEPGIGILADIEWTEQAVTMLVAREYRYLSPVVIVRDEDRKVVAVHSAALTNKPAIVGISPIINRDETDTTQLAALRAELGLADNAEPAEVLTAAGQYVARIKAQSELARARAKVARAAREGKLVEAQRAWAEALVAREEELFDLWQQTAPVVVQTGAIAGPRESDEPCRDNVSRKARSEFRDSPLLQSVTSEDAYMQEALRETLNVA